MVITDDPPERSDSRELLARACAGDADAFCRLAEPLQARLLRQAVALTGDVSAAEDLVSETLVEAWKSLPRYNQTCRLSTWLYAILLHRHRKAVRHARCRPVSLAWLPFFEARQSSRTAGKSSLAEDLHRRKQWRKPKWAPGCGNALNVAGQAPPDHVAAIF